MFADGRYLEELIVNVGNNHDYWGTNARYLFRLIRHIILKVCRGHGVADIYRIIRAIRNFGDLILHLLPPVTVAGIITVRVS